MNLEAFNDLLRRHTQYQRDAEAWNVAVVIESPGSVGGTPRVGIKSLQAGFDWDARTILLFPEAPLTKLSAEDVEAIRDSVRKGGSWHAYQAWKKQQDRIKELEAEIASLRNK